MTVEFVIIFPILMLMLIFIVSVSLFIATASDVQQVAAELARASFGILNGPLPVGDLCTRLAAEVLPRLIEQSTMLDAARFQPLAACPGQPDSAGVVTVSVTYDLGGSTLQALGDNLGFRFGLVTREAAVRM